jgi:hypothetical protein
VSFADYQAWPGVNPSTAKYAVESAYAYKHFIDNPKPQTKPQAFGEAVHLAVWEPDRVLERCVMWKGARKAGKVWNSFKNINRDKLILNAEDYGAVLKIRDRIHTHPAIKPIIEEDADREVSMRWDHNGIRCKGRTDQIGRRITDLKTAYCIADVAVERAVRDLNYHMQLAAYRDGFGKLTGEWLDTVLIFACTNPPYDARVVVVEGPELKRGWTLWKTALERIRHGRETGEWPGVSEEETSLALPLYALDQEPEMELTLDGEAL